MAEECFALEIRRHPQPEGFARAHIFTNFKSFSLDKHWRRCSYSSVEVISTQAAMDLAITKHCGSRNDLQAIETLVQKYISSKNILAVLSHPIRLAEGLEISGFAEAVEEAWKAEGLSFTVAKRSLIASLAYLHPKTFPPKVEPGFTCDGCTRDGRYNMLIAPYFPKVYLEHQLHEHIMGCPTAQDILAGVYLTLAKETALHHELYLHLGRYFVWPVKTPDVLLDLIFSRPRNMKPNAFMQWHTKMLSQITEFGEAAVRREKAVNEFKCKVNDNNADDLRRNTTGASTLLKSRRIVHPPTVNSIGCPTNESRHLYGIDYDEAHSRKMESRIMEIPVDSEDEDDDRRSWQNPTKARAEALQDELTETEMKLLDWAREEGLVSDGPADGTVDWHRAVAKGASFMDGTVQNAERSAKHVTISSTRKVLIPKAPSFKLRVPRTEDETTPPWQGRIMCARTRREAEKKNSGRNITEDDNMSYIEHTIKKMELQQKPIFTAADSPLTVKKKSTTENKPYPFADLSLAEQASRHPALRMPVLPTVPQFDKYETNAFGFPVLPPRRK